MAPLLLCSLLLLLPLGVLSRGSSLIEACIGEDAMEEEGGGCEVQDSQVLVAIYYANNRFCV